ncbi:hypothetical protein GCM10023319_24210 [Nocardia iowensis]
MRIAALDMHGLSVVPDSRPNLPGLLAGGTGQFGHRLHLTVPGQEPFAALRVDAEVDHFLTVGQESVHAARVFAEVLHRVGVPADAVGVDSGPPFQHPRGSATAVAVQPALDHSFGQPAVTRGCRVRDESLDLRAIEMRFGLGPGPSGQAARMDFGHGHQRTTL